LPGAFAACIVHGASVSTARAVTSVFKRFRRWVKGDAFCHTFTASAEDADFEHAMIDVSRPAPPVRAGLRRIVKFQRHGQGAKRGPEVRPSGALAAA